MSRKYKFRDQDKLYFITFAVVNWINLFVREHYNIVVIDSVKYCQKEKGLEVYAWCIMTSHIHMIMGTHGSKMEEILGDFKSFTSTTLKKAIRSHAKESRKAWILSMMTNLGVNNSNNRSFQLWQQNNHPIELFNNSIMEQRLNYIHNNPVKAGYVRKPEDYIYRSAEDYVGKKGVDGHKFY